MKRSGRAWAVLPTPNSIHTTSSQYTHSYITEQEIVSRCLRSMGVFALTHWLMEGEEIKLK